jgi:F420-non-reducing hydrogenase iron-sulfur subunit
LENIGLEGQRLQMINVSAAMAGEFTFSAAEITAEIRQMGPNPLRTNGAHSQKRNHAQAEHVLSAEDADND